MSARPGAGGLFGRLFARSAPPAEEQLEEKRQEGGEGAAGQPKGARPEHVGGETGDTADAGPVPAIPAEEAGHEASHSVPQGQAEPVRASWFDRLKAGLKKTSGRLSDGIAGVFVKRKLDEDTLEQLEDLLIQADLGVETAGRITDALAKGRYDKGVSPAQVRAILAAEVEKVLRPVVKPLVLVKAAKPHVILTVGVNGTGKTTTIGKLAASYVADGKKVMLAAGDTFRAAAIEQLKVWGERAGATVVAREVGGDAAGLAFDALTEARAGGYDVLLIDTAGRLQNKQALMDELGKIVRVLKKIDPAAPHDTVLILDATTGQNALDQVQVFQKQAGVSGLVMTKLDGTARGGILVAIASKFGLPVHAIGVGESVEDLHVFDAGEFARAIAAE